MGALVNTTTYFFKGGSDALCLRRGFQNRCAGVLECDEDTACGVRKASDERLVCAAELLAFKQWWASSKAQSSRVIEITAYALVGAGPWAMPLWNRYRLPLIESVPVFL
jgi:hypothetical protein